MEKKLKPGDRIQRFLFDVSPNTLKIESLKQECHIEVIYNSSTFVLCKDCLKHIWSGPLNLAPILETPHTARRPISLRQVKPLPLLLALIIRGSSLQIRIEQLMPLQIFTNRYRSNSPLNVTPVTLEFHTGLWVWSSQWQFLFLLVLHLVTLEVTH